MFVNAVRDNDVRVQYANPCFVGFWELFSHSVVGDVYCETPPAFLAMVAIRSAFVSVAMIQTSFLV